MKIGDIVKRTIEGECTVPAYGAMRGVVFWASADGAAVKVRWYASMEALRQRGADIGEDVHPRHAVDIELAST